LFARAQITQIINGNGTGNIVEMNCNFALLYCFILSRFFEVFIALLFLTIKAIHKKWIFNNKKC